ncbi:MAG TPA: zf-HC2 domain-containing protein [Pyrinomonadaceae bacterium]|nr:zf-HC2 domain-containing protein [Pyrinomonadaceae bacterium]
MNCEECLELLSEFLDGTLGHREHAAVSAHLAACPACAFERQDFHAIISAARDSREHLYAPPDERALWLRVRNAVESETRAAAARPRESLWQRLFHKRWELSLPQLAAGVAAIAASVAFVTAFGVGYVASDRSVPRTERAVRRVVSDETYPNAYVEPNEASLRYWEQRVEARKASWNPRMRASFDQSLSVLDQTVNESLEDLRQNPHDEVAEEALNSALQDKAELLREFGE